MFRTQCNPLLKTIGIKTKLQKNKKSYNFYPFDFPSYIDITPQYKCNAMCQQKQEPNLEIFTAQYPVLIVVTYKQKLYQYLLQ